MLDLAIIGSGPAALSAAIYAARANLNVQVFEKAKIGGALTEIANIENFPGHMGPGSDLAIKLKEQAEHAGAKIVYGEATKIIKNDDTFELIIDEEKIEARAVIVATGSESRPLDFESPIPVSYCALCDGALYKGKNIAVVGGGNSAIQESIHLAQLVDNLEIFSHHNLTAEPYLVEKLSAYPNVKIHENVEVTAETITNFDGTFVFIGKRPASTFVPAEVCDGNGYIVTKNFMTKIPGLFAAGDVRKDSVKQALTAASDGAMAALAAIDFLS